MKNEIKRDTDPYNNPLLCRCWDGEVPIACASYRGSVPYRCVYGQVRKSPIRPEGSVTVDINGGAWFDARCS